MKKLLAILLLTSSLIWASQTYFVETIETKRGVFAKIVNDTSYDLVCVIDNYKFDVPAYSDSLWYPVGNRFYWECR